MSVHARTVWTETTVRQRTKPHLGQRLQDFQQSLTLLPTIAALIKVVLHQEHRLGSIKISQFHLHETIQVSQTLIVPDFVEECASDAEHLAPDSFPVSSRLHLGP